MRDSSSGFDMRPIVQRFGWRRYTPGSFTGDTGLDITLLYWLLAIALMATGFAGLIVPVLPGVLLIYAGIVLAAWIDDFAYLGWPSLTVLGVLALVALALDSLAGLLGAKKYGASPRALLGAAIGAVVGLFFGLPGLLLGPLIGAVLGELSAGRGHDAALRAGFGSAVGFVVGTLAKVVIGVLMMGVFLYLRLST